MLDASAKEVRTTFNEDTRLASAVSGATRITVAGEKVDEGEGVMVVVASTDVLEGVLDADMIGGVDLAGKQAEITRPRMNNFRIF